MHQAAPGRGFCAGQAWHPAAAEAARHPPPRAGPTVSRVPYPGNLLPLQVHLCGSFTRWVETVPMTTVEGQPGTFTVVVHLPPG